MAAARRCRSSPNRREFLVPGRTVGLIRTPMLDQTSKSFHAHWYGSGFRVRAVPSIFDDDSDTGPDGPGMSVRRFSIAVHSLDPLADMGIDDLAPQGLFRVSCQESEHALRRTPMARNRPKRGSFQNRLSILNGRRRGCNRPGGVKGYPGLFQPSCSQVRCPCPHARRWILRPSNV